MTDFAGLVSDGMVVSIAYQLRLDDGQLVDEATTKEPFAFIQGQGQLMPVLERALSGMRVGERKKITVTPEEGFGDVDEDQVVELSWDELPDDVELTEGDVLDMEQEDTGELVAATVIELNDDGILLDLNHPLAGETLYFSMEVLGVRPATAEELAHGHVHGDEHHH